MRFTITIELELQIGAGLQFADEAAEVRGLLDSFRGDGRQHVADSDASVLGSGTGRHADHEGAVLTVDARLNPNGVVEVDGL